MLPYLMLAVLSVVVILVFFAGDTRTHAGRSNSAATSETQVDLKAARAVAPF
jgi:hypothetical protein